MNNASVIIPAQTEILAPEECGQFMNSRLLSCLLALTVVIGVWKGYVALFDQGAEEPKQIFPCPVEALPEADQAALENGIIVRNQRDLQQILEDYLS